MALLDFSRFGVAVQDVRNGVYSYIIGFDLGDGEVSATYWNLKDEGFVKPIDLKFDRNESTKVASALFIEQNGNVHIGSLDLIRNLANAKGRLYSNFKVNPERLGKNELYESDIVTKKRLMQLMLRNCIEKIAACSLPGMFEGRGLLVVGCPSSPEWLDDGKDIEYAGILAEGLADCGLNLKVVVMPESRASLIKVYKEQADVLSDYIRKGVAVVDNGSSTLDITLINFDTNRQFDYSIPLGANKIERAMLNSLLREKGRGRSELLGYSQHLLDVRACKEAYFSNPAGTPRVFLEYNDEGTDTCRITTEFMERNVRHTPMSYTTAADGAREGTWYDLHKNFTREKLEELCRQFACPIEEFEGVILLTGGASKMKFIEEIVRDICPKAHISVDNEPSYCVSRGLAWAAYTDLKSLELIDRVKEEIKLAVQDDFGSLVDVMAGKLAPMIYDYAYSQLAEWVETGDDVTPSELVKDIEKSFLANSPNGRERKRQLRLCLEGAILGYLNNNTDKGVRSIIVTTVNNVFARTFPGKINVGAIRAFTILDDEWKTVIDSVSADNLKFGEGILDALDLENIFVGLIKALIGLAVIAILWVITFGLADLEKVAEWVGKMFVSDQKISREKRQRVFDEFKSKKQENTAKVVESIKKNFSLAAVQDALLPQMAGTLNPAIDRAVNVVSIYF